MSAPRRLCSLVVLATVSCISADAQAEPAATAPVRNDYSMAQAWLCRPGRQDACAVDLSTTSVSANGKLRRESFKGGNDAPIDCYYDYPTVTPDLTGNSAMNSAPEEKTVIQQQFARFAGTCRLYAPLYRQLTLVGLRGTLAGNLTGFDRSLGYNDVADAWKYYLEHDNDNRGVVLIGHSQGSAILEHLLATEIEGKPVQSRLVSALLIGSTIRVPKKADVGGTFKTVPLCRSEGQTGCIVTYASFRSNVPPPDNSRFGKVAEAEQMAACTNPASLAGGKGELHAYLAAGRTELGATLPAISWTTASKSIDTPFVTLPGLLSAQCVNNDYGSYLEIKINADPGDPRTDDIPGDVITNGGVQRGWGLHLIDVNLALGNLLDIVAAQSKAYLRKRR
jgi:pimeloyl-ACP methyl ester carboxylesterase